MSGNSKMFNVFAVYAVKCRKREEPSEKQQIIKFQLCEIIFLKIGHNYSGNGNAIATLNYLTQTTKMRFHKTWNKTKKKMCASAESTHHFQLICSFLSTEFLRLALSSDAVLQPSIQNCSCFYPVGHLIWWRVFWILCDLPKPSF